MKKVFLTALCASLVLSFHPGVFSQPQQYYGQAFITDFTDSNVVSDGINGGKYVDNHLSGGDPCVTVSASERGGAGSLYPPRLSEGTCSPFPPQPRYVRYYLPDAIAGHFAGCTSVDSSGRTYVQDVKRMMFPDAYAKDALTKGTDGFFGFYCGGAAYSIQPVQKLNVIKLSDTKRQITNVGAIKSQLFYPSGGDFFPVINPATGQAYAPFDFNFSVIFESVTPPKRR